MPVVLENGQTGGLVLVFGIEAGLDSLQFQQFGEIQRPLKAFVDQFVIAIMEPIGFQRPHMVHNRLRIAADSRGPAKPATMITATYEDRMPGVPLRPTALASPDLSEMVGSISTRFVAEAGSLRRQAFRRRHSPSAV
jgi:hypothetical protein